MRGRRATLACLALLSALVAPACGGGGPGHTPSPPVLLPLTAAVSTAAGRWVALPVDGLTPSPEGPYWQLLFQPTGSDRWADATSVLGTATNGGIVLAGGAAVTAAVIPSGRLTFSPVLATTDGSRWSSTVLPGGVTSSPFALSGPAALTGGEGLDQSLYRRDGSSWQRVAGSADFRAAMPACRPSRLDSVLTLPSNGELLGAACSRPGVTGLALVGSPSAPKPVPGPPGPEGVATGIEAISVTSAVGPPSGMELSVLLETGGEQPRLYVAGAPRPGAGWAESPPLDLAGASVTSAVDYLDGFLVLLTDPGGHTQLWVGSSSGWRREPSPPEGTALAAPTAPRYPHTVPVPAGPSRLPRLEAFVTGPADIEVWALDGSSWNRLQILPVDILYGA